MKSIAFSSQNRRSFLKKSIIASLGASFFPIPSFAKETEAQWGIILNTVQDQMEAQPEATLEALAEMGYTYVESGVYGKSRSTYARMLNSLGLKCIGGGSSIGNLIDNKKMFLKNAEKLSYEFITCYWPWMGSADSLTKEMVQKAAESLNKLGKELKAEGLQLSWHNHDKEFVMIEGKTAFDWLMELTDPEYVALQMDVYWVRKGGADPVALMKKYAGRVNLLHLKDMDASAEQGMTCPGDGIIDFQEVFNHAQEAGVIYATVENEQNKAGLPCAENSISYLKGI
ncbi:MAG: TIM barrel protein, partial [Bacteroidota bacterium]